MKTINENQTICDFKARSGAVDTQKIIIENGKAKDFERLIDELYPEGLTETKLNNLLWFEDQWLFDTLGIETEDSEEDEG